MKLPLLIILLFPLLLIAQTARQNKEQKKAYMQMADSVQFPRPFGFAYIDTFGGSKQFIYSRCYEWLAKNVTNYTLGAQMKDSLSGKIVIPEVRSGYNPEYRYTITIDVREGKFRCVFSDFYELRTSIAPDYRVPFDTIAQLKMIYMGPGNKHQYWQAEKLHEKEEVEAIFAGIRANVRKKDDF